MQEDDPIVTEFVIESREHLADVENQLLAIEAGGATIDVDLVNTVFRAVHSIKGAAGFIGFETLGKLAHSLENVLNLFRNLDLVPDATNIDVLLRAADTLTMMIDDIHHSNEVDIADHVSELEQIVAGDSSEENEAAEPETAGEATSTDNEPQPETPSEPVVEAPPEAEETVEAAAPAPAPPAEAVPAVAPPAASAPVSKTAAAETTAPVDTNIRVSVRLLDSLMNLAGELVLSRNQLVQKINSGNPAGLDSVAAKVDQITSELQEAIMQTRMQTIGMVFSKFPRIVRDLSRQLGKRCELTVKGEEVELDKTIIEAIGDPLTHLIRNSVDHGIESQEDRAASGKAPCGTISLRAYHQAGKVNISIQDDGGGIDGEKLKAKAVERGIITMDQAIEMGDREAVRLIFHPGFSMAQKVTSVSGRGVGMDVVKTNIEKLGGAVSVDTELGRGTTINIRLPLTLAIVPSLIVRCSDRRFAVPQTNIRELVRIKKKDSATRIERVKNAEVFRLRGKLLPLVRLGDAIGVEPGSDVDEASENTNAVNIIVVEAGQLRYGLVVDGLHDSEEIVVKPLGRHIQEGSTLAGATILGDGQVALILDVAGIATHCNIAIPEYDEMSGSSESSVEVDIESQTSLLFTNHCDEQFGIPMESISRLELVRTDQIEIIGNTQVLQFRGISLPVLDLESHIQAKPRSETDSVYIVVFSVRQRELGLIVPNLIDIREISTLVDTITFSEPGVVGSVLVEGQATRLLDLYELTKHAHPDWIPELEQPSETRFSDSGNSSEEAPKPRVLVAEDSTFFRHQIIGFMEEVGYEVIACEDGQIGWNTLQEWDGDFDVVVTDIEMPNMDGCDFARAIKTDPLYQHLPVIAVTSLASEEHMQRGLESGIDEYLIKLDRERLMSVVAEYVRDSNRIERTKGLATASMGS